MRKQLITALKYQFFHIKALILFILMMGLLISSIMVIILQFYHRRVVIDWQKAEAEKSKIEIQWTQIVLEHSMLASSARVDAIAKKQFNMALPDVNNIHLL